MPLPLTGETATHVERWIAAIVAGGQEATLLWDGERFLGAGSIGGRGLLDGAVGLGLRVGRGRAAASARAARR